MDLESILALPKQHRYTFIGLLISLFVIALLIDSKFSELSLLEAFIGYIRSIAAAILTSLFLLWVITSFLPHQKKGEGLTEIEAQKITKEFDELLKSAKRWRYKGNFGRYMRGKVLPTLANQQNCHISACIIDPTNNELCDEHARYRSQINSIDKGSKYDADTVALQVLVTVVICAWYSINTRATIELYLSQSFDPVRIDSNDDAMIITVEDRRSHALKVTKHHFTYEHFEMSMEFARKQGRKVNLGGVRSDIKLSELQQQDVSTALNLADMSELCQRLTPEKILQACLESKNPYEN
ncbi:hypothetical protein [Psychrobacter sp. Pi2-51]|uniref:hypothetical protein n=1 Tax=Psychrobacter sp. Pi2-51 TaxID=2774132 RepID=UPI0019191D42|nr:hypothetical protein [Psychrobacter sp. Pi2-51]